MGVIPTLSVKVYFDSKMDERIGGLIPHGSALRLDSGNAGVVGQEQLQCLRS